MFFSTVLLHSCTSSVPTLAPRRVKNRFFFRNHVPGTILVRDIFFFFTITRRSKRNFIKPVFSTWPSFGWPSGDSLLVPFQTFSCSYPANTLRFPGLNTDHVVYTGLLKRQTVEQVPAVKCKQHYGSFSFLPSRRVKCQLSSFRFRARFPGSVVLWFNARNSRQKSYNAWGASDISTYGACGVVSRDTGVGYFSRARCFWQCVCFTVIRHDGWQMMAVRRHRRRTRFRINTRAHARARTHTELRSGTRAETLKMVFTRRYADDLMDRGTWCPFACHTRSVMIKNCIWHETRVQCNYEFFGPGWNALDRGERNKRKPGNAENTNSSTPWKTVPLRVFENGYRVVYGTRGHETLFHTLVERFNDTLNWTCYTLAHVKRPRVLVEYV